MDYTVMLVTACMAAAALLFAVAGFRWRWAKAQSTPGSWTIERAVSTPGSAAIQRDFRNVFAMMGKERQEGLITGLMQRKKCTRHEAMRLAVEEWRHERRG